MRIVYILTLNLSSVRCKWVVGYFTIHANNIKLSLFKLIYTELDLPK